MPSAPDALSFNRGCTSVRLAPSAGRSPNNAAVTIVTAAANTSVRAFGATSSTIGPRPRDIMASEQIGHPVRERHSGRAAGGGEERTLRQELAHDPPARGSQRQPDRDLLLSRARANDQQAREIGAGDEQHHAHRRHQNLKRQRELPAELVQSLRAGIELERHRRTRRQRLRGGELRPSDAQRRPRLLARHARREPPDQVEPSSVRRHLHRLRGERRRDVDVASRLCPEELRRRDADDRERAPLHLEQTSDDVRVAGEPPLPVAMADHRDGFAILFGERPSEHRAERRAPRGSCPTPDCVSRELVSPLTLTCVPRSGRNAASPESASRPGGEIRGGSGGEREDVPAGSALTQHDEIARVGDGKRPQEHGVRQGEDRRVRADAERERQHRDRREERVPAQAAEPVANVATDGRTA